MEFNNDIYNLIYVCMIANSINSEKKIINSKLPNRVKIIRDFDNLLYNKKLYKNNNLIKNNIQLSDDKLFSKLQKNIFRKIENYNSDELKTILINDMNININLTEKNIYEIANYWCKYQYGLI